MDSWSSVFYALSLKAVYFTRSYSTLVKLPGFAPEHDLLLCASLADFKVEVCTKYSIIDNGSAPFTLPPGLNVSVSTLARIFFCCKLARASLATLTFKPGGGESIFTGGYCTH
jgi:hypothetical protein